MNIFKTFLTGFLIGVANLIPGVSGGTFALILGIYERLIGFLNSLNGTFVKEVLSDLVRFLKNIGDREERLRFVDEMKKKDLLFISIIGLGAVVSILALSSLMKFLILNFYEYTYAYFFGLILISVYIPFKLIKKVDVKSHLMIVLGIVATVWVSVSVDPSKKVIAKSNLNLEKYEKQYHAKSGATMNSVKPSSSEKKKESVAGKFYGKYSTGEYFWIFLSGVIAISAMVLPGISGSLVLILMGSYFTIISAVSGLKTFLLDEIALLGVLALGLIIGIVGFARVIEFCLKKFHDLMMAFLVGLIAGSLYTLWPFKKFLIIDFYTKAGKEIQHIPNYKVYTNQNILDFSSASLTLCIVFFVLGIASMWFFVKNDTEGA